MRALLTALILFVLGTQPVFAQSGEEPQDGPSTYPTDRLQAEAAPLYLDELTELATMWQDHLRQATAQTEWLRFLAASDADPDLKAAESTRDAIAERLGIIVDSIEAKGGDGKPYRDYIAATTGPAVDWLNLEAVSGSVTDWLTSPEDGIRVGLNIVKFVAILIVAWIIAKILSAVVAAAVRRLPKASELLRDFLVKLCRRIVMIVGFVVALGALGVNVTPLVAAIGAAGLVIGLALQGTLSNFASGILILIYRPFDVGDVINAGGVAGKVEAMNLVSTRMLTFDNQVQIVPNNGIWNGVITNITGLSTRRVDMTFGIGYSDDMAKAESIIRDVIGSHDKVLADPAPVIKVHELADSSVNFIVRPWSNTADYWDVFWDVTRSVKERFDAEGVGIPFPQRDIHIPEALRVVVSND